jgi:hypothetical protein
MRVQALQHLLVSCFVASTAIFLIDDEYCSAVPEVMRMDNGTLFGKVSTSRRNGQHASEWEKSE